MVKASANEISLEVRGNHDYFGHIYVGSDYIETRMIFDTMSKWSVLQSDTTTGGGIISNYELKNSKTA